MEEIRVCPQCNHPADEHELIYSSQRYYCEERGCDCNIKRKDLYPEDGKILGPVSLICFLLLIAYLTKEILYAI